MLAVSAEACDSRSMEAARDIQVLPGVQGRTYIVLDERGIGLRATWHPTRGFINVSLWRDDRCVETFHLTPQAASDLVAFVVRALASSVPGPAPSRLRLVRDGDSSRSHGRTHTVVTRMRQRFAHDLEALARRLRR